LLQGNPCRIKLENSRFQDFACAELGYGPGRNNNRFFRLLWISSCALFADDYFKYPARNSTVCPAAIRDGIQEFLYHGRHIILSKAGFLCYLYRYITLSHLVFFLNFFFFSTSSSSWACKFPCFADFRNHFAASVLFFYHSVAKLIAASKHILRFHISLFGIIPILFYRVNKFFFQADAFGITLFIFAGFLPHFLCL
jgi:hypothetical protein